LFWPIEVETLAPRAGIALPSHGRAISLSPEEEVSMRLSVLQIRLLRWLYLDRLQNPEALATGSSSYRTLAVAFSEHPSSITRSIQRLERKGLVVVERSPAGRVQRVQLTLVGYQWMARFETNGFLPRGC
jgi:DNA-binding MarR family transcriptional regulator